MRVFPSVALLAFAVLIGSSASSQEIGRVRPVERPVTGDIGNPALHSGGLKAPDLTTSSFPTGPTLSGTVAGSTGTPTGSENGSEAGPANDDSVADSVIESMIAELPIVGKLRGANSD
ncbi:MAG: hypothetical protein JWN66_2187 [Sphingomonas bacterium]|nr:hypothetical protein [Sphingomonas bacterium]